MWPGLAAFPDFTDPKARAWWGEKLKGFLEMGVAGFWLDMNEPALFAAWGSPPCPQAPATPPRAKGGPPPRPQPLRPPHGPGELGGVPEARPRTPPLPPHPVGPRGGAALRLDLDGGRGEHLGGLEDHLAGPPGPFPLRGLLRGLGHRGLQRQPLPRALPALVPDGGPHPLLPPPRRPLDQAPGALALRGGGPGGGAAGHGPAGKPPPLPLHPGPPGKPGGEAPPQAPLPGGGPYTEEAFLLGEALLVAPVLEEGARAKEVPLPKGGWYPWGEDRALQGPTWARLPAPWTGSPSWCGPGPSFPSWRRAAWPSTSTRGRRGRRAASTGTRGRGKALIGWTASASSRPRGASASFGRGKGSSPGRGQGCGLGFSASGSSGPTWRGGPRRRGGRGPPPPFREALLEVEG